MATTSDDHPATANPHFTILNKLVQPDATAESVTIALKELDDLVFTLMADPESEEYWHHASTLWSTLFEQILPHAPPILQSKLVEFVIQLRKKTLFDPKTGEPMRNIGEILWTELPCLGIALFFTFQDMNPWDPRTPEHDRNRWKNQSAFVAQLYSTDEFFGDLSIYPLWSFRTAFESIPPSQGNSNDTVVEAACWWLIYAADKLWANVLSRREWDDRGGMGGTNYRKRPWRGYSRKRWAVWEQGLVDAFVSSEKEETKALIRDALLQMERVAPDE